MGFMDQARASVGSHIVSAGEHMQEIAPDFAEAYDKRAHDSHRLEAAVRVAGRVVQHIGYGIVPELLHAEDAADEDK